MNWTHIIVHHTAGADREALDREAIRRFHVEERGWRDIGYHYVVERVGEVYVAIMGRPMHHAGAHAPGFNRRALGVALVGDFTESGPPIEQLRVSARLIAGLCVSLDIELANIHSHRQVGSTACPGDSFPWAALLNEIRERL